MRTTTLVQAARPDVLQAALDALIAAGKVIYSVTVCHEKSFYLVYHDA